ncbi:MAG: FAD-dependent oxidoreductase [Microcoleus sp.]
MSLVAMLSHLPLFKGLTPDELNVLKKYLRSRRLEAGEVLFNEGDTAQSCFVVISGTLSIYKNLDKKQQASLATLSVGALVGHMALIDRQPYHVNCCAEAEKVVLIELLRSDFDRIFYSNNPFAFKILDQISIDLTVRLRETTALLTDLVNDGTAGTIATEENRSRAKIAGERLIGYDTSKLDISKVIDLDALKFELSGPMVYPSLPEEDLENYLSIIENGLEKATTPKKIIVVGAGIAGLTAAYELLRAGHDPLILEASHRVGGRCYTMREPFTEGLYAEAGAMRFPPVHKLLFAYIRKFEIQVREFKNYNPNGWFYLSGKKQRMSEMLSDPNSMPSRCLSMWNHAIQPLVSYYLNEKEKGNNVWPEIAKKYNEYTLRDFLAECNWREEDIKSFSIVGLGLGGWGAFMNIAFLELFRLVFAGNDDNQHEIIGGCDRLAVAFLKNPLPSTTNTLDDHIRYGAKVTDVKQNYNKVTVRYETLTGSYSVDGDYAIMTVPFPLVRFIEFTPSLSAGKQRAINELHYIASTKIFLQCKSRFWENAPPEQRAEGMTVTDLPIKSLYFPGQNDGKQRNVIIASYTWESDAQVWEALTPEERIKEAIKCVAKIYPEIVDEFEVGASCTWNDPKNFSGGAFALYHPGQMAILYDDMIRPEGLLHFAGEHASFEHGWIQGAIESGLREALAIDRDIKMRSLDPRTQSWGYNVHTHDLVLT